MSDDEGAVILMDEEAAMRAACSSLGKAIADKRTVGPLDNNGNAFSATMNSDMATLAATIASARAQADAMRAQVAAL